jgi:hypothetical protein
MSQQKSPQKRKEPVAAEPETKKSDADVYKNHKVDEHTVLAKFVGTFDAEFTMFENGKPTPTAPAQSTGVSTWNGNIIVSDFTMMFGDMEFKGECRYSFCTINRKFQSIWVDNMATGQFIGESRALAPFVAGKPYMIELFSPERLDSRTGKTKTGRSTYVFNTDGTIVHESFYTYVEVGAKEEQDMKIVYKPRK